MQMQIPTTDSKNKPNIAKEQLMKAHWRSQIDGKDIVICKHSDPTQPSNLKQDTRGLQAGIQEL